MNKDLIEKRKKYFGVLFSIFILFALLILLKIPLNPDFSLISFPSFLILLVSTTPAFLILNKDKKYNTLLTVAYIPALVGFLTSLIFNNSLYFLMTFPVFLLNFILIFPKR
ncbi:hypothetical protein [Sulfurihydrogenibium sp.]|uniref:hypothetical protein n=1 Tax=Sulfurihydrogenibium sp. TaxID=2053621 RepID=UPI00260EB216|nr:hypothetical protein [Sulfurihydrogenibium sp.]